MYEKAICDLVGILDNEKAIIYVILNQFLGYFSVEIGK